MIETIDDIIEGLADELGIYGSHIDDHPSGPCRSCWTSDVKERLIRAAEFEDMISEKALSAQITTPAAIVSEREVSFWEMAYCASYGLPHTTSSQCRGFADDALEEWRTRWGQKKMHGGGNGG